MADVPRRACRGIVAVAMLFGCFLVQVGLERLQAQEPARPPASTAPSGLPPATTPLLPNQPLAQPPAALPQRAITVPAAPSMALLATETSLVRMPRFHFKIEPNTPVTDLLPVAPKAVTSSDALPTDDLSRVPEVLFQDPWAKDLPKDKALERTAHDIAKINHLNQKDADGFLKALRDQRRDLAGLAFAMGDACRTTGERSREFKRAVATVRASLPRIRQTGVGNTFTIIPASASAVTGSVVELSVATPPTPPPSPIPTSPSPQNALRNLPATAASPPVVAPQPVSVQVPPVREDTGLDGAEAFWEQYRDACAREDRTAERRDSGYMETVSRARVAALMQILAPESPGLRLGLVKYLSGVSSVEATRALAKLALFSSEEEVRHAAVDALQVRRERDYTQCLLDGLRYPLPAVAKRAAEALVKLERKDLVAQLVDVLDAPDPRAPRIEEVDGRKVPVVHELVRLNHHRSCLLCHAPGNTAAVSPESLTVPVPVPGEPLPPPSQGYNDPTVPDILVRIDVTYLRQDFSMLLPVADANPWPEMQRFDYLVRRRALTEAEAQTYAKKLASRESGQVPPHRRAVLTALRELTGKDTDPTARAWRKMLNLHSPSPLSSGAG